MLKRILFFVLLLNFISCTDNSTILLDNNARPAYYVDGYIDANRGAKIYLRRTIPINEKYNVDSTLVFDPPSSTIKICNDSLQFCQVLMQTSSSTWELSSLSDSLGKEVTFSVEVEGQLYTTKGRLPDAAEIIYTPISTSFKSAEETFEVIFQNAIEHRFNLKIVSSQLLPLILWPDPWSREPAGVYYNPGESNCTVNGYSFGLNSLGQNCSLDNGVDLSAYQFGIIGDTMSFFISTTYDLQYDNFLQAFLQNDYDDSLGGLFDVLLAEGNIEGLGGFVLFSASKEISVTP